MIRFIVLSLSVLVFVVSMVYQHYSSGIVNVFDVFDFFGYHLFMYINMYTYACVSFSVYLVMICMRS